MLVINQLVKNGTKLTEDEMRALIEPVIKGCSPDYWLIYSEESKGRLRDAIKLYHPKRKAVIRRWGK